MRVVATALRAAFRLLLGILVTCYGTAGVLYLLELVLTPRYDGPGAGEAARTVIYSVPVLPLALVIGLALAVLCDRVWLRIRGFGPGIRWPAGS